MTEESKTKVTTPTVVKVLDEYHVVVNRGSEQGLTEGSKFLVYFVDPEELIDPETGRSLGNLEIVRGTASATHVQLNMSTLKSNRYAPRGKIVKKRSSPSAQAVFSMLGGETETIEQPAPTNLPFENARVGDKAKPI